MELREGHTYRIFYKGEEIEHFHVARVHGRRISFAMTAYSSVFLGTTRCRWKKAMDHLAAEGPEYNVTEEVTVFDSPEVVL